MFIPWQQTSRGTGRVIAFVPQERQQTVNAPISGVVDKIAPNLREGDFVRQGDFIVELQPIASNLSEQIDRQIRELEAKLAAIEIKREIYASNIKDFTDLRDFAVNAATELVEAARRKLEARQKLVPGFEAKVLQAELNFQRLQALQKQGARPMRDVEIQKKDLDVAKAELKAALAEVESAEREVEAKRQEYEQRRSEGQTRIDSTRALEQGAIGEAATVKKEIAELQIRRNELSRNTITAPRAGTIFRLPVYEKGQTVTAGDPLFTIVPETKNLAVELWVSGLDITLIEIGDHVRLQFEGWPAVQVAGWPSIAIGTFGGEVVAIDDTDDGTSRFRIQIRPENEDDWPGPTYLRQGVRANGWVTLRRVTLGYELWRQLNGFPPYRSDGNFEKGREQKSKPPKIKID